MFFLQINLGPLYPYVDGDCVGDHGAGTWRRVGRGTVARWLQGTGNRAEAGIHGAGTGTGCGPQGAGPEFGIGACWFHGDGAGADMVHVVGARTGGDIGIGIGEGMFHCASRCGAGTGTGRGTRAGAGMFKEDGPSTCTGVGAI